MSVGLAQSLSRGPPPSPPAAAWSCWRWSPHWGSLGAAPWPGPRGETPPQVGPIGGENLSVCSSCFVSKDVVGYLIRVSFSLCDLSESTGEVPHLPSELNTKYYRLNRRHRLSAQTRFLSSLTSFWRGWGLEGGRVEISSKMSNANTDLRHPGGAGYYQFSLFIKASFINWLTSLHSTIKNKNIQLCKRFLTERIPGCVGSQVTFFNVVKILTRSLQSSSYDLSRWLVIFRQWNTNMIIKHGLTKPFYWARTQTVDG